MTEPNGAPEKPGQGRLVVITGPSGVGKSTIVREVVKRTGAEFSISVTTRLPRSGEVEGADYYFAGRGAFGEMVRRGELLEWADVFGDMYGTPAKPIDEAVRQGQVIVLEIDVQGGLQVYEKMPQATFILVLPPSEAELASRLKGRGSETEESFQKRLAHANREIETAKKSGVYNDQVINDDLEAAIRRVVDIVENP